MVIGSCTIQIRIFTAQCLKDKRRIIKSILDKIRHRFNAAAAEVSALEDYRQGTIGIAVVSNEHHHAREMLNHISRLIEGMAEEFEVTDVLIETW